MKLSVLSILCVWATVGRSASEITFEEALEALKKGELNEVRDYLINTNDVNESNEEGITLLHEAASFGLIEVIRSLMDLKANVNVVNKYGWTPLHRAAYYSKVQAIELLVLRGANLNSQTN